MSDTTLTDFVNALRNISISGLAFLDGPPAKLNPGDLPVCWINSVGSNNAPVTRGGGYWATYTAELYVPISPVAQDTRSANFARAVVWADAIRVALEAAELALSAPTVSVRVAIITVAQVDFWGVTTTVEAEG